jgi:amidohydrolase
MEKERIFALAHTTDDNVLAARRRLHQYPELSFQEQETAAFVAERLRALGYEPRTGVGGHGVVAVLRGERPGRTVGLRADMDALPLNELSDLPFKSSRPGIMHACGHDAHTAMLLGAAEALAPLKRELAGNVVFLFQPAEELPPGGAQAMIADGALDDPKVDCVFGLHQGSNFDVGSFAFAPGPRQASTDTFRVAITGPGGHAAMPHFSVDVIAAAAAAVTAIHQIVSRRISAIQPAVITIGQIHGGTKENIIPERVEMAGTVRVFQESLRATVRDRIREAAEGAAAIFGAQASVEYEFGYPSVVNDAAMTEIARRAAAKVVGEQRVYVPEPIMPAEDFSYFLQKAPGAFGSIGVGTPGSFQRGFAHSPTFFLDEAALPFGVAYYVALVTDLLGE